MLPIHVTDGSSATTPQSARGALVLGRTLGDEIQLRVRGEVRGYVIAEVA